MQQTSLSRYATDAAASLPSSVARISRAPGTSRSSAPVVVVHIAVPDAQLDHRVLGAGAQAAIALGAVAARETPASLIGGLLDGQPSGHLAEARDAVRGRQLGLLPARGIAEEPKVQHVECRHVVLR